MRRIVALAFVTLVGCASPTEPTAPWSDDYDAAWEEVVACWDAPDTPKPTVVVRETCRSKWAHQDFNVGGDTWVFGTYSHNIVTVCPDLGGLRHEFSEHVRHYVPGGSSYLNGSGKCWM